MKFFTYKDYIKSIHALRLNAVMQVAEKGEEYQLNPKEKLTMVPNLTHSQLSGISLQQQWYKSADDCEPQAIPLRHTRDGCEARAQEYSF